MRGGGGGSTDLQLLFEAQRPQRVAARRESAMQINSDKDAQQTAAAADTVGPLNAHEADRCVEDLCTFSFEQIGGHKWMTQHESLEKLNVQTHVNASQQRDEFVMEALVLRHPFVTADLLKREGAKILDASVRLEGVERADGVGRGGGLLRVLV